MIPLYDFHSHSSYTDGRDSVETMVSSACSMGLKGYGISEHLYYDMPGFGFKGAELDSYLDEAESVKEKYRSKIDFLIGLEVEDSEALKYITPQQLSRTDYLVRSCHGIYVGNEKTEAVSVDSNADTQIRVVNEYFNGDWYGLVRTYYEMQSKISNEVKYAFIAHFDLVTKYNQDDCLFRTDCDDYLEPAMEALHSLLRAELPFEINSGAMSRGYRKEPYPSVPLLKEIKQCGGRIMINSDSHASNTICHNYLNSLKLAYDCGFRKISVLTKDGEREIPI